MDASRALIPGAEITLTNEATREARIVDHATQQYPDALAVALQRDVAFDRLEFGPSGARDQRQQAFADAVQSQYARCVHVAQNTHNA